MIFLYLVWFWSNNFDLIIFKSNMHTQSKVHFSWSLYIQIQTNYNWNHFFWYLQTSFTLSLWAYELFSKRKKKENRRQKNENLVRGTHENIYDLSTKENKNICRNVFFLLYICWKVGEAQNLYHSFVVRREESDAPNL